MNEPTTLHKPNPPLPASPTSVPEAWATIIGALLILAATAALILRRRRDLPAQERAFRSLSHRMGLSRRQISGVRRYARSRGMPGPIAVLMSGQLLSEALNEV